MSAFAAVRQREAVHLLTDGVTYTDEGVVTNIRSKVFAVPGVSAAITLRGETGFLDLVQATIDPEHPAAEGLSRIAWRPANFDELVVGFEGHMAEVVRTAEHAVAERARHFQMILVGWSESRGRGEIYRLSGVDDAGLVAGRLEDCGEFWGAPDPTEAALADLGFSSLTSYEDFRPDHHGVLLLEAMRRVKAIVNYMHPGASEGYGVGGFIQCTTVNRKGATTRILKRWPDKVGEKIVPEPLRTALPLAGNRKQRRAAEAAQRRAA